MPLPKLVVQVEPWVETLLKHSHRRVYNKRSTVIRYGDKSDKLYYIISGSVSVSVEDDEGRRIVLAYLSKGDFIGEMGLFDVDTNRSAQVVARDSVELAEISYEKFKSLVRQEPDILFAISKQIATRLRKTSEKVRSLVFLDVKGRVASTLIDLARQPDAMTHPDGMQIRITRQEIGRIVGSSREMVGRVLKELEDENLITAHGKTMVIFGTR